MILRKRIKKTPNIPPKKVDKTSIRLDLGEFFMGFEGRDIEKTLAVLFAKEIYLSYFK